MAAASIMSRSSRLRRRISPRTCTGFKWDAYLTWVTGFGLLIVQYYLHAKSYLIDPAVMALEPSQAVAISIVSLLGGWAIYEAICRSPLGRNTVLLSALVFALILAASVLYTKVFLRARRVFSMSEPSSAPSWRSTCS